MQKCDPFILLDSSIIFEFYCYIRINFYYRACGLNYDDSETLACVYLVSVCRECTSLG